MLFLFDGDSFLIFGNEIAQHSLQLLVCFLAAVVQVFIPSLGLLAVVSLQLLNVALTE